MYGMRNSRTTKPRQVQLIVVRAKICSSESVATVLFPRMKKKKIMGSEAELEFAVYATSRRETLRVLKSSDCCWNSAGTPSTLIL